MSIDFCKYIDVHLHLQDGQFDDDREQVITAAAGAGVEFMFCCGSRQSDWQGVIDLAARHKQIIPFIGLHPWFVDNITPFWLSDLRKIVKSIGCGIGEIGLDRLLTKADFGLQKEVFVEQVLLAKEFDKPVSIHCLNAYGYLRDILEPLSPLPQGSFIHSYSGSPEMIAEFIKLGLKFSYNAKITDKNNRRYRAALAATPLESLLFETDSPFMPPQTGGEQETRNTPLNMPSIVAVAAEEILKIPLNTLLETVYQNSAAVVDKVK